MTLKTEGERERERESSSVWRKFVTKNLSQIFLYECRRFNGLNRKFVRN